MIEGIDCCLLPTTVSKIMYKNMKISVECAVQSRITASQALSHPWLAEGAASQTPLDFSIVERMEEFEKWTSGRKILMTEIGQRLQPCDIQATHDQFALLDTDHDGKIVMSELERVRRAVQ